VLFFTSCSILKKGNIAKSSLDISKVKYFEIYGVSKVDMNSSKFNFQTTVKWSTKKTLLIFKIFPGIEVGKILFQNDSVYIISNLESCVYKYFSKDICNNNQLRTIFSGLINKDYKKVNSNSIEYFYTGFQLDSMYINNSIFNGNFKYSYLDNWYPNLISGLLIYKNRNVFCDFTVVRGLYNFKDVLIDYQIPSDYEVIYVK